MLLSGPGTRRSAGTGKNMLGRTLMETRIRLRADVAGRDVNPGTGSGTSPVYTDVATPGGRPVTAGQGGRGLRERAVRMVAEVGPQCESEYAAITAVADKLGDRRAGDVA